MSPLLTWNRCVADGRQVSSLLQMGPIVTTAYDFFVKCLPPTIYSSLSKCKRLFMTGSQGH